MSGALSVMPRTVETVNQQPVIVATRVRPDPYGNVTHQVYLDYAECGDLEDRETLDAWEDLIGHLPAGLEISAHHHEFLHKLHNLPNLV
jgi:hypothetical protein